MTIQENKKPTVIVFYSLKGGTGKSSSTILTSNCLASAGKKVLVIDLDLNNSTSFYYLNNDNDKDTKNVARALQGTSLLDYVLPTQITNVDIIQSSLFLVDLRTLTEKRLKSLIPTLNGAYDYVVIDCPPSYDNIVINAFYAADFILTPILLSQFDFNTALFLRGKFMTEVECMDKWYLFFNQYEGHYDRFINSSQSEYVKLFKDTFPNVITPRIPKSSSVRQYIDRGEEINTKTEKIKLYEAMLQFCSLLANELIIPKTGRF